VFTPDKLNDLMAVSDYVVMALPYTEATHHFVNAAAIDSMKPNGVLINVGRGKTLEEAALIKGMPKLSALDMLCLQAAHVVRVHGNMMVIVILYNESVQGEGPAQAELALCVHVQPSRRRGSGEQLWM
jgi:hypothetical protein